MIFIEGEKYKSNYGLGGWAEFTPIIMIKGNKEYFIQNQVKEITRDSYSNFHEEQNTKKIENLKEQLLNNDGQYITFNGREKDPFDFINWMKENNYTFRDKDLFDACKEFTDFHGNLKEYSSSFHYRIYDEKILRQLKKEVKSYRLQVV